jgi:hypothetical protein
MERPLLVQQAQQVVRQRRVKLAREQLAGQVEERPRVAPKETDFKDALGSWQPIFRQIVVEARAGRPEVRDACTERAGMG